MSEEELLHSRYGAGKVVAERYGGFEKRMVFRNGLERWVRLDDLKDVNRRRPVSFTCPTFQHIPVEKLSARQLIEALAWESCPTNMLKTSPSGAREKWKSCGSGWVRRRRVRSGWLGNMGQARAISLATLAAGLFLDGFAVASVDMDPNENPFHKPKRVYARLVQSFRYISRVDNRVRGFRDFLKEALEAGFPE